VGFHRPVLPAHRVAGLLHHRTPAGILEQPGGKDCPEKLAKAINPAKELRNAIDRYAIANTAQNAINLASQHLLHGNYSEARDLFVSSLSGIHADDPDILLGLANAHFGLREYKETLARLDTLKEKHPKRTSPEGHLLYARALFESGRIAEATIEYESLVSYFPGPEPACRLALIMKDQGDLGRAQELFQSVLKTAKVSGKHYNTLNSEWVSLARREARS
jgi:hypothetical protein